MNEKKWTLKRKEGMMMMMDHKGTSNNISEGTSGGKVDFFFH